MKSNEQETPDSPVFVFARTNIRQSPRIGAGRMSKPWLQFAEAAPIILRPPKYFFVSFCVILKKCAVSQQKSPLCLGSLPTSYSASVRFYVLPKQQRPLRSLLRGFLTALRPRYRASNAKTCALPPPHASVTTSRSAPFAAGSAAIATPKESAAARIVPHRILILPFLP